MSKFGHREEIGPVFRFIRSKQLKVGFQLLIYSFHLSIHLWVIGCGQGDIIIEESGKLLGKDGGELRSPIGDYLGM